MYCVNASGRKKKQQKKSSFHLIIEPEKLDKYIIEECGLSLETGHWSISIIRFIL